MRFLALLPILFSVELFAGTNGLYSDAASWTGHVYIATTGDSLVAGGGASPCGIYALSKSISNASGGHIIMTNFAISGTKWTDQPTQLSNALACSPRWVFIGVGRNDVLQLFPDQSYPGYWPTIAGCLDSAKTNCRNANANLMIGEILPAYTASGYPGGESFLLTVRGYNSAYAAWCNTNDYSAHTRLVKQHDAFGDWDSTSGGYDYLHEAFTNAPTDALHINQLGFNFWGPLLVNDMEAWFYDPPVVSPVQMNVGNMGMAQ